MASTNAKAASSHVAKKANKTASPILVTIMKNKIFKFEKGSKVKYAKGRLFRVGSSQAGDGKAEAKMDLKFETPNFKPDPNKKPLNCLSKKTGLLYKFYGTECAKDFNPLEKLPVVAAITTAVPMPPKRVQVELQMAKREQHGVEGSEQQPALENLLTIKQLVQKYQSFTESAIRNYIFKSRSVKTPTGTVDGNGFDAVIVRVGRKILIGEPAFLKWILKK